MNNLTNNEEIYVMKPVPESSTNFDQLSQQSH